MSAVLSDCGTYRYRLTRSVGMGDRAVTFVGVNPSTADATVDDATVRKWAGFSRRPRARPRIAGWCGWGCGMSDFQCALRDCSYDDKPRRSFKFHAVKIIDGHKMAACGDGFLIDETAESMHGTVPSERCRRSGCRQEFEAAAAPTPAAEGEVRNG